MVALHREESFVIIELGSHTTKAMQDVTDVNKLPTVVIRSRAGIAKQDEPQEPKDTNMSVDDAAGEQAKSPQAEPTPRVDSPQVETPQPVDSTDKPASVNGSSSSNSNDQDSSGPNYVFGSALESASTDTLETTVDIISGGFVKDWDALSAFLRHIVTKELGIRIPDNTSAFLFSIPALWPKSDLENLAQIAFEDLNAPSIMVVEQPLLAAYGNGGVTGVVIDMGHDTTTITPIVDSIVQNSSITQTTVSGAAVTARLHELLEADTGLCEQFEGTHVPLEFATALKESGLCTLQLPSDQPKNSTGDSSEQQSFEFGGKTYMVGKKILAQAPDILVHPTEPSNEPALTTLIRQSILACDTDKRSALWENMHVVGGSSQFGGLRELLQFELENTVLPASNIFALSQTRDTKFHTMPEYFVGWRGCAHWAAFLGACLVAKVALADARHFVSRAEYNDGGPSVIHTKSF
ncbi:hypothetical protein IWW50_002660 [Coemansia erecta]|nr:hypothetical protein GGF43_001565 [Coemansia sp. RSA 2618]KAJ2825846.1 hypothetical protein IWW50_002660 [Coemansia erecta]